MDAKSLTVGLTLFESQIARNFLCVEKGNLVASLSDEFNVVIITNTELEEYVNIFLARHNLKGIEVSIFSKVSESWITRIFSSPLRWGIKSDALLVKANRKSKKSRLVRLSYRSLVSKSQSTKKILRAAVALSLSQKKLSSKFASQAPENLDFLISTSLTNFVEDYPVCLYFKRSGTKIIGTVRSWDNLTSHGSLYLEPNLFLSHSPWMSSIASGLHKIAKEKIVDWGTPPYLFSRFPNKSNRPQADLIDDSKYKIVYASMGTGTNPDDKNFIDWLIGIWHKLPSNYSLTILQHPKFVVNPDQLPRGINLVKFNYEQHSLGDYFSFLSQQHLVICGGTSVILDCAFVEVPVVVVGFEIIEQQFWRSSLRYLDFMDHTMEFINSMGFQVARSWESLLEIIISKRGTSVTRSDALSFLGKIDGNPATELKWILRNATMK